MSASLFVAITCLVQISSSSNISLTQNDFIFEVINKTVELTGQRQFIFVNLHSTFFVTPLIKTMCENSISINIIDYAKHTTIDKEDGRVKNMLVILNNCNDILNIILDSVTNRSGLGTTFQNYCFHRDFGSETVRDGSTRKCDDTMHITDKDLEQHSELPDDIFNRTRRLYSHAIWNAANHLVFFIPAPENATLGTLPQSLSHWLAPDESQSLKCDLLFTFKLMWRFFRGIKSVICLSTVCYRYHPFKEIILTFRGAVSEPYFDFKWESMNGKELAFFQADYDFHLWSEFSYTLVEVLFHLQRKLNYTLVYTPMTLKEYHLKFYDGDIEEDLKHGIDLHVIESGVHLSPPSRDLDKFEELVIDTGHLCFVVPRKGLMPQYLTVFKSFETSVWICIVGTSALFYVTRKMYDHIQLNLFQKLYTEKELQAYEGVSVFLAVYSYFLCVAQPKLFFKKLTSGKAFFGIFSFSTVILATAFQGQMVKIINKQLHYPDIDSLADLKESNVLIQASDILNEKEFLSSNLSLPWMRDRLIDSFRFQMYHYDDLFENAAGFSSIAERGKNASTRDWMDYYNVVSKKSSISTILRTDGFLKIIAHSQAPYKNFWFAQPYSYDRYEYHKVEECLMSFPYMFHIVKHSFFWEKFKDAVSRFAEGGHFVNHLKEAMELRQFSAAEEVGQEFRPYGMSDLQIAFYSLYIGLAIGAFAFIGEMLCCLLHLKMGTLKIGFKKLTCVRK